MITYTAGAWLYGTIALLVALSYMLYLRLPRFTGKEALFLLLAVAAGFALFAYEGVDAYVILGLEVGIFTFNGLLNGNSARWRILYVLLSMLYITFMHWIGLVLIAQAMLIGILSSITNIKEYKTGKDDRAVEVNRDVVHLTAGIALMAIFYFSEEAVAISALMVIILGGIVLISLGELHRRRRFPSIMFGLERAGTSLGHGALWLALGSLLAVSFLDTSRVLIVFSAIFVGDPIATIVGMHFGKRKLPYNARKSTAGTVAYFVSTWLVSSVFAGVYGAFVGAIGAVVESMKLKVDDNFTVSVALVVFLLLLGL